MEEEYVRKPKRHRYNVHISPKRHRELCEVAKEYNISIKKAGNLVFAIGRKQVGFDLLLEKVNAKRNLQGDQEVSG